MSTEAATAGVASRLAAARVLTAVFDQGRSLKAELAASLPGLSDPRDRALVEAICFAVLRRRPAYDVALRQWLERPLPPRDAELKALLMAGFAQLDVLQLPAHAALSATVDACRALGRPRQAGMVNAILRRAQREGFPAVSADAGWPSWLRKQLRADWGDHAETIFVASALMAPMWLRVHRGRTDPAAYVARLAELGIAAEIDAMLPDAVRLHSALPVSQLPVLPKARSRCRTVLRSRWPMHCS